MLLLKPNLPWLKENQKGLKHYQSFALSCLGLKTCLKSLHLMTTNIQVSFNTSTLKEVITFCPDVTSLPFHDETNDHFLFDDIQIGKGNIRGVCKTKMILTGRMKQYAIRQLHAKELKSVDTKTAPTCMSYPPKKAKLVQLTHTLSQNSQGDVQQTSTMFGQRMTMTKEDGLVGYCVPLTWREEPSQSPYESTHEDSSEGRGRHQTSTPGKPSSQNFRDHDRYINTHSESEIRNH